MTESPQAGRDVLAALRQLAAVEAATDETVSTGTRAALIALATGDLDRAFATELDWDELFRASCRHGLVPLVWRYLQHRDSGAEPCPLPKAVSGMFARTSQLISLRLMVLYRAIGVTLDALSAAGLDPLVLKGPAIAQLAYPEPLLRPFGDLDLLVRGGEVAATHRALLAQGFAAVSDPGVLPPRLTRHLTAHELRYWHPERHLLVEVHIDDPFNTGLVARDLADYWRRAVGITVAGTRIRTLGLDDQVVQLCAHAHYHGYARLNWLADLALLIGERGAALDWDAIVATVRAEEIQAPVYSSLRMLHRTLGIAIPSPVLAAIRPDAWRRWWHERYLPEDDVAAGRGGRPFAGFYFFPVFTRLVPDLLVMGRRRDKLRCLVRLLLPPPDWLRAYYQLPAARSVWPHYALHPLKLLAHMLAELPPLLTIARRRAMVASAASEGDVAPGPRRGVAGLYPVPK